MVGRRVQLGWKKSTVDQASERTGLDRAVKMTDNFQCLLWPKSSKSLNIAKVPVLLRVTWVDNSGFDRVHQPIRSRNMNY